MKKTNGLIIKTTVAILFIGSWLIGCRRDLLLYGGHPVQASTLASGSYAVLTTQLPTFNQADVAVELGMKFKSITAGKITQLSYYKVAGETGTHTGHLWSVSGTLLKSAVFTSETDTGWQFVTLDTAYNIGADTTFVVSVNSVSHYASTSHGLASVINNGPLSSIADNNGVYIYTPGSFPNSSYNGTNYFRDIVFVPTANDPIPPSVPGSLTATSITSNSAILSWTASTDNIGVTGYEVYRNGILIDTTAATTLSVTHLNAAGAYSFYVKARDAFGNRSAASNLADFLTINPGTVTQGSQLTTSMVGPAGISISSFTTVPGGSFYGTALAGWGNLARTLAAGGETIDGFWFPQGTVVLQAADITSQITVYSGWLVLRGCKGSIIYRNPIGDGGGGATLYSQLTAFNTNGRKDGEQPAEAIVHRCYFPNSGLENVYADNITVTESWITPDPSFTGEHVDGIQTWGGQSYLNFSRNHFQFNAPDPDGSFSGLIAMYTDGSQAGYSGYDHITVKDNYIILDSTGIGLHAPLGVPVTNMSVTGNRWKWTLGAPDKDYSPAVYTNTSQTIPNYKTGGNSWSDNRWVDGPYANQFLLPNNVTASSDY
ncbi:chitodextrinase [Chitinophaga niastensis]|uniref:Chitodextrinase n=1 Tax=Chitinophaga niastensis TaxID=536980 RepID=A0A2P8HGT0_CHINA|nr:DUF4082 domain-containing protein [Chitinophaga niastensis]PSL45428.1 chitodextrinase [Chitinophaga niastensis]